MEKRGFLLHQTLESVSAALTSSRIRLTCVDVSHQYILLGANTGSVYVFERETAKFIQLLSIDAMRDPVALLRFSPDEKYLALVNNKSKAIFVMEFALKIRRSEKELLKISSHKADISHILWVGKGTDMSIFSADESGAVYKTAIGSRKSLFSTGPESDLLYQCDTRVVQMSYDEDLTQLILSSMTKSVMIDFRRTQAFQVGTKPRDGPFGASHWRAFDASAKDILLARPGKRIWCADTETARVKQTINYQPSFESTAPSRLFAPADTSPQAENVANINFCKLLPFCEVVLSLSERVVVLMDADTNKILQWHCDAGQIVDISLHEQTTSAYAIVCPAGDAGSQRLAKLTFNILDFVSALVQEKQYSRAVSLVKKYSLSNIDFLERLMADIPDESARAVVFSYVQTIQQRAKEEASRFVSATNPRTEEVAPPPAVAPQDLSVSVLYSSDASSSAETDSIPGTPTISSAPLLIPNAETPASTPLSRSPSMLSSRDDLLDSSTTISASSSPGTNDTPKQLSDSQLEAPALAGSFLKAEEAPAAVSPSNPIAAPVAKRTTGGAKKKKPRLAQIAPPSVGDRAPSPIMLEMQQRAAVPSVAPQSAQQSSPSVSLANSVQADVSTEEDGSINTSRLPMVIPSALSAPINAPKSETSSNSSPSSSPSLTPSLLHAQSAPLSTSPTSAVSATADKAMATADKALGEIKSMAKKIIDLPSMFSRTSSAPVPSGGNSVSASPAASHIDTSDETTSLIAEKLRKFRDSLTDVTKDAKKRSPSAWEKRVIFDETMRSDLQQWFDTYCSALSSSTRSGKFPLGSEIVIRELVTACFEFQVENSSLPASKLRFWTDKDAHNFASCYSRYLSLSDALFLANERGWSSCVEMLLNYDESLYASRETHLLNPRFRSWEQIEELMQESRSSDSASQQSLIKLMSKVSGDLALTMRFLPRLFDIIPSQALQLAVSSYPALRPSNVEKYTSKASILLQYYSKLMKKHSSCRSMPHLVLRWIQLLLDEDAPSKETLFDGDKPLKGSHSVAWKSDEQMQLILSQAPDEEYALPEFDDLASLFAERGYWSGLFFVLCRAELFLKAAQLAIDLDSAPFFSFLLRSPAIAPSIFQEILHLVTQRHQADSLAAVSPSLFFAGCVEAIGARQTMVLIESLHDPVKSTTLASLKPSFFQTLLRSSQNERTKRAAIHEILETADSYLWSMRSPAMASQFRALEQAEAQEARLHDNNLSSLPYISTSQGFDGKPTHSVNILHRSPLARLYGSLATHWGVRTSLRGQPCPRCELPLHDTVLLGSSSSSTKVVVFDPCGHAFHESCVEEDCCVICLRAAALETIDADEI